jgi:hypothetical protein
VKCGGEMTTKEGEMNMSKKKSANRWRGVTKEVNGGGRRKKGAHKKESEKKQRRK